MTWQLSLPEHARESLSRTAERANIGATAFTRAKRQLKDEGFVHERRLQGPGGLWVTQQLVSSVPLSEAEAAKLFAQTPVSPAGTTTERVSPPQPQPQPQPRPTAPAPGPRIPTVGEPTGPVTDGSPTNQDPVGTTSHQPPRPPAQQPAQEPALEPALDDEAATPHLETARALVDAFPSLSPDLLHIPRAMRSELTRLTARWLAAGHGPADIRTHLLRGLPDDGTPVRRPGGFLRHLLGEVPPPLVPPRAALTGGTTPPQPGTAPGSDPAPGSVPRLSPRLAGARECAGDHVQPLLFRPVGDETHCPRCRAVSS
ncbi:hypothetical protein [Streptomyces thermocarboxydovorans]|uniref:hypothetical protein n=1 Tax=Streptomyces thermocarboxydovorans TaxID=59298 RepID=UPI0031D71112